MCIKNSAKFLYKYLPLYIVLVFSITACGTVKKTHKTSDKSSSGFYKKYSKILGVELSGKEDKIFIEAVSGWLGTPYVYGGSTKKGTDCSGFVYTLYKELYNKNLYRSAVELLKNCKHIDKKNLKTGDLVFFKINSDKITHVGIYIYNNKFIHASSSKGVIVSDLNDNYYVKYYFTGGRIENLR